MVGTVLLVEKARKKGLNGDETMHHRLRHHVRSRLNRAARIVGVLLVVLCRAGLNCVSSL